MSNDKLLIPPKEETRKSSKQDKLSPVVGEVSRIIGSGENAQHSIVYKTISWSFTAGVIFSLMLFVYAITNNKENPLELIKGTWAIFVPIITLSLGYIFGKSNK
mgnify:CR=1 FL=1